MEFLNKMKSRERIEMILKTISVVIIGLMLIILMEGMIYSIYMNKINENTKGSYTVSECVAYCEEVGEDKYKVILHDTETGLWLTLKTNSSKQDIEDREYGKVVWSAPTPFDVSITPIHYVVMGVFILAIIGFYGWKFYKLDREYKKFEKRYKKTGKIFA